MVKLEQTKVPEHRTVITVTEAEDDSSLSVLGVVAEVVPVEEGVVGVANSTVTSTPFSFKTWQAGMARHWLIPTDSPRNNDTIKR